MARIPRPVVLVGHSIGGFYATFYTDRFNSEAAGMVLVEPGFAGQTDGVTGAKRSLEVQNSRASEERLLACAALARRGKMALDNERGCVWFPAPATLAETAYLSFMVTHPYWYEAEVSQSRNFFFGPDGGRSLDTIEEEAARRSFGAMPLIVLNRVPPQPNPVEDAAGNRAFEEAWTRL